MPQPWGHGVCGIAEIWWSSRHPPSFICGGSEWYQHLYEPACGPCCDPILEAVWIICDESVVGPQCGPYTGASNDIGGCVYISSLTGETHDEPPRRLCQTEAYGWEGFVCGPRRCPDGPDASRGNSFRKPRRDHECPQPNSSDGGVRYSMGNCFGDVFTCAINVDTGADDLGFEEVKHMQIRGWIDPMETCFRFCDDTWECFDDDYVAAYLLDCVFCQNAWVSLLLAICLSSWSSFWSEAVPTALAYSGLTTIGLSMFTAMTTHATLRAGRSPCPGGN